MNNIKVGVTGTREGATAHQLTELRAVLAELSGTEFHHGDCCGVDEQAADIARQLGYKIICHPPKSNECRAFTQFDESRSPLGYLARDRAIAETCDVLLVVPLQDAWQPKGGTWYTHDYARKINKPLSIIWPHNSSSL
jgi:hypothetical protein